MPITYEAKRQLAFSANCVLACVSGALAFTVKLLKKKKRRGARASTHSMKTKAGYETNGDYIKFKSGFTGSWNVETENKMEHFKTEDEADAYIVTKVLGCEKGFTTCKHFKVQKEGCNNCEFGFNSNCANGGK